MERGILRTFKPDGTPVEVYDAEALTKAEFTVFNTYSTDEIDTGKKWIDGKTIYQKVVPLGNLPNSTTKIVNHNILNINEILSLSNTMAYFPENIPDEWVSLPAPSLSGISYVIEANYSKTYIKIITLSDRSLAEGISILYYTCTDR